MSRGPKRTPLPLLEMRGSRLPKLEGRSDIPHVDGDVECPSHLGNHGRAKWLWLYPLLRRVEGLMKPAYMDALAAYCDSFDVWMRANESIRENGLFALSEKGVEYQHPAVGIARRARADVVRFGAMFGLNPADATKVTTGGESSDETDPFAAMLSGRN